MKIKYDSSSTKNPTLRSLRELQERYEKIAKDNKKADKAIQKEIAISQAFNHLNNKYNEWTYIMGNYTYLPPELLTATTPSNLVNLFCVYQNSLTTIGNNITFSSSEKLFHYLISLIYQVSGKRMPELDYSNSISSDFFKALYDFLNLYPLSKYYSFLQSYVNQFEIHSFFYNAHNFIIIDSNIYVQLESIYFTHCLKIQLMNDDLLSKLYPSKTKYPTNQFFKQFYKKITSTIPETNIYSTKKIKFLPFSFCFEKEKRIYNAQLLSDNLSISDNANFFTLNNQNYFTVQQLNILRHPIPKVVTDFLSVLTSNNIDDLNEISSFWAMLSTSHYLSQKKKDKKMFILNGSTDILNTFEKLLFHCNLNSTHIEGLNLITKKHSLLDISLYPFNGIKYIAFNPSKNGETIRQQEIVKSLLKGTKIQTNNNIGLPIIVNNLLPLVCFSNSTEKNIILENTYPTHIINLDFNSQLITEMINLFSKDDFQYLSIFLSMYGLLALSTPKNKAKNKAKINTSAECIYTFIDNSCEPKEGSFIYFEKLYDIYTQYCDINSIDNPLTYIRFNKLMKEKYKFKRPHTTKSDNRWAYCDISLKEPLYLSTTKDIGNTPINEFKELLSEKSNYINTILQNAFSDFIPKQFSSSTNYFELIQKNHRC